MNKPRSPSVDRICDAAVIHFSQSGYDAASLADIAATVGIRKASLYTHFPSKDALFMQAIDDALALETAYVAGLGHPARKGFSLAHDYCGKLRARFRESAHLRFLLRSAFMPPAALRERIGERYESYLATLVARFQHSLAERRDESDGALPSPALAVLRQAYLGFLDSLHVELLYTGGEHYTARLKAFDTLMQTYLGSLAAD